MSFIQQFFTSRDNNANAETFVGQEGRLWWDPVTNQIYSSDGSTPGGIPLAGGGGGNGTPGGANGQVQFNNSGSFGGSANLTFNRVNGALTAVSFVGDGSGLSNIAGANISGTVSDADHATVADSANSVAGGNVTGNVANAIHAYFADVANSVSGANVSGAVANATYATTAGSATSATNATTAGTVTTAAQPNITSVGTLTSVTSTGNISTTGNVSGNYFIGNGSLLTGIATSSYGNANVAAYLASGTNSSNISTTGNVTGAYLFGNGSQLSVGLATYVTANAQANITSVGTLTVANISGEMQLGDFSGSRFRILQDSGGLYIQGGNGIASSGASVIFAPWLNSLANATMVVDIPNRKVAIAKASPSVELDVAGAAAVSGNITGGNLRTGGFVSATGNITGNYILGNGSQLTGIVSSYGNANVAANLAAFGSNPISTTGNVDGGNINTAGAVRSTGSMSVVRTTGQQGEFTFTDGVGSGFVVSVGTGLNTWAGGGSLNLITSSSPGANIGFFVAQTERGRFTGSGLSIAGTVSATGNITGANVVSNGVLSAVGRTFVASGNATAPGVSFASDIGSDSGFYLISDGNIGVSTNATLRATFLDTGFSVVGNVTGGNLNTSATISGGTITATTMISSAGNVIAGNVNTGGLITATGNITGGNINTAGRVSVTGNINAGNLITTGAVYSNYNTNTANTGSFMAQGGNTKGGTGYLDFLVAQNTSGGATNPYKWFRLDSTGTLQIINSAYTAQLLGLSDSGDLNVRNSIAINGSVAVNGPAFAAYFDPGQAAQTVTSGSLQKVLFNAEEYDTNANFASSRFTPTVAGYYQFNATVRVDGSSGTGETMLVLYKNGAEYKRGWNSSGVQFASDWFSMSVSSTAYANGTGDYFEIYIQQTSGSSRSLTRGQNLSWFNGCMLRGA